MQVYGKTDIGLVRTSNQDNLRCGCIPGREDELYAVVCDGMGGANGGDIASFMAVELIEHRILSNYRADMSERSVDYLLESAIYAASINIYDCAAENNSLLGMGTTVVAVTVFNGQVHVAYVGDSRAYLVSEGEIRQITHDHSVVQEMIDSGKITEVESKSSPHRHVITRALGVEDTLDIDFVSFDMPSDGKIIICTDGLTDMLETDTIYSVVTNNSPEEAVGELIEQAKANGGKDNITAVLIV